MKGSDFKKWAEISYQSYGKDTWFFIRELAQNSRDAGATVIQVETHWTNDEQEILTFTDNGCGMGFNHARQYLFRLYASSKTGQKFSAGMYGAGFWTILRYHPEKVIIESVTKGNKWAVSLGQDLQTSIQPCTLQNRGTRISLIRNRHFQTPNDFKNRVKKALIKYCQYLRKSDISGNRLPVIFQGEDISKPMRLSGPFTHHFRKGAIEGAIGLASEPKVELYAKGLPVWQGTTIDELSHTYSANIQDYEVGSGLAPVFLLNGNNLDVNISRKSVIDNQALKKLRETARKNLSRLIVRHAEEAFPRSIGTLIMDFFSQIKNRISFTKWKLVILALIIIIPLEYMILKNFFPATKNIKAPASILSVTENRYAGATVKMGQPQNNNDIRYSPPVSVWLKLFTANQYDLKSGFINSDKKFLNLPEDDLTEKTGKSIVMELRIKHGGKMYLPQPVGHLIEVGSLTFAGKPVSGLKYTTSYEAILSLPSKNGILRYRCLPMKLDTAPPGDEIQRWLHLPAHLEWPVDQRTRLDKIKAISAAEKVKFIINMITSNFVYDSSPITAAQYQRVTTSKSDWFSMVRQIGKGDCDILNGVSVMYLRYLNVPARLVIGFIGKKGRAAAGLHAWTEYYDNGWKFMDVSQFATNNPSYNNLQTAHTVVTDNSGDPSTGLAGGNGNRTRSIIYLVLTICISLLMVWFGMLLLRRRRVKRNPETIQQIRSTLVQMAVRAILQPEVWGYDSQIWNYRIIPTFQKKNISLKTAFLLAGKQKLFTATPQNPLLGNLIDRGYTVLNHQIPEYNSLIQLIPGKIDLDSIHSLNPSIPQYLPPSTTTSLLGEINLRLKPIIGIEHFCHLAEALGSQHLMEIKLPIPTQDNGRFFPKHFLIINPGWDRLVAWGELYKRNPQLAVFKTVSHMMRETKSLRMRHTTILNRLAKQLVKEIR